MSDRKTRGRPSKIDRLDPSIKQVLDQLLREGKHTQQEILAHINQLAEPANQVSRSGLNRYATRMESVGARLRETREVANVWMARFGEDQQGSDVLQLVVEMMQAAAFKHALQASDSDDELFDPAMLKDLALTVQRLSRSAEMNAKREQAIRKEMAEQAATAAAAVASSGGMSKDTVDQIKREILGIA